MINKKLFLSTLIAVAFVVGGSVIGNTSVRRVVCAENIETETSLITCEGLEIKAKAAYMMDFSTQTPIYSKDEMKRLPIASMCKIMTLLLAFEAVETGELTLDELVMVVTLWGIPLSFLMKILFLPSTVWKVLRAIIR